MARVQGKVAIVTGGASGIGEASAKALAREGATVVVTDLQDELGHDVVQTIRDAGGAAEFLRQDVSDEAAWEGVFTDTVKAYGAIHVLVNNAGIGAGRYLTDTTLEQWRSIMSVNLDGVFLGMKHGILAMREAGGGSIINISSIDGIFGAAGRVPYCASKGGVRLLTKAAAIECAEQGDNVRINSIHPGPIATNIFANAIERSDVGMLEEIGGMEGVRDYYIHNTPMARFGMPDEIAAGVVFLASDESSFMTGSELIIDGGWTAGRSTLRQFLAQDVESD